MTLGELAPLLQRHQTHRCLTHRRLHAALDAPRVLRPNRPSLGEPQPQPAQSSAATILLPALTLLEPTNATVGRGTPTPFELIPAPAFQPKDKTTGAQPPAWFHACGMSLQLAQTRATSPASPLPQLQPSIDNDPIHPYHGQTIEAVRITVTDRQRARLVPSSMSKYSARCTSSTLSSSTCERAASLYRQHCHIRRHHPRRRSALHRRILCSPRSPTSQDRPRAVSALQVTIASPESHPRSQGHSSPSTHEHHALQPALLRKLISDP